MIRLTGGALRGGRIRTLRGRLCRPTQGRLREALFSCLGQDLVTATVLDLFAGAGTLGIEALSRGAATAIFVEHDRIMARCLQENLRSCGLAGRARVRQERVERVLPALADESVDLVLADPPYDMTWPERAGWEDLGRILRPGGFLALETAGRRAPEPRGPGWVIVRARRYGDSRLTVLYKERGNHA